MESIDDISSPSFLVGAERSGTTLLRLMLDHHPDVAWLNEFEYAVDFLPDSGGWPDLYRYYEWLSTNRVFVASNLLADPAFDYPALVTSFLRQKRDRDNKSIVGATVHRHFDRLLRIWPEAKFIHLVRDGRDVARSNIGMGWASNIWTGASRWIEAEELWDTLAIKLPQDRWIEIKSEELMAEPEQTLGKICAFVGVPFDPAMLSYPSQTTYEAPDPSLSYQWKHKLSEHEIRLVESRIAPLLERRGYELSGLPPLNVTPAMIQRFQRRDRLYRLRFRAKRYGWPLVIQDAIARRVGPHWWQKQIQLRLNAIAESYLK